MRKVLYVYRTARQDNYFKVKKGLEPDHLLYGLNYLENEYQVEYSDIAYKLPFSLLHHILYPLEYLIIKSTSIGFKLDQAILLLPKILKTELIVTTTDSAGLPILLFKWLKLINKPVIYISTGLINELVDRKNKNITKLYKRILEKADIIVTHSVIEKKLYLQILPNHRKNIHVLKFGVDLGYFKKNQQKEEIIFSVGRDRSRDFRVIAYLAKFFLTEKFVVITSQSNIKNIKFPSNVKVLLNQPYWVVKKYYDKSKMIILPLKEINRAAGQIAFLEAVALGKKVLTCSVLGLTKVYPSVIKNNPNIYLYRKDSINSIVSVFDQALQRKTLIFNLPKDYSSENYGLNLLNLIKKLL